MSVKQFNLQLNKEIAATDELIEDKIIEIGLGALGRIVKKTPVDTGRLRSNWIVSRNIMSVEQNPQIQSPQATITKGNAEITKFNYKKDQSIIIQNNLKYAPFIENGTSRMRPQPMVAPTITEIQRIYRNVVI